MYGDDGLRPVLERDGGAEYRGTEVASAYMLPSQ